MRLPANLHAPMIDRRPPASRRSATRVRGVNSSQASQALPRPHTACTHASNCSLECAPVSIYQVTERCENPRLHNNRKLWRAWESSRERRKTLQSSGGLRRAPESSGKLRKAPEASGTVSYTHLRAHETSAHL
eukprot:13653316-Alexandrium_andersonii.AAC.1